MYTFPMPCIDFESINALRYTESNAFSKSINTKASGILELNPLLKPACSRGCAESTAFVILLVMIYIVNLLFPQTFYTSSYVYIYR